METFRNVVFVLVGIIMIVLSRIFARLHIAFENALGFKFSEKDIKISTIVFIICGIGFIIFGLSLLLGILKMKQ